MTYICCINDNICPLILKRHIYTLHISFKCRIIFNAHFHVMYYKQPCRLQPTTSYHTVLDFPILARVTAHKFSCMFISNGLTSPKWSPAWPTPRLKLSRVQVLRVTVFSICLKMGLCAGTLLHHGAQPEPYVSPIPRLSNIQWYSHTSSEISCTR